MTVPQFLDRLQTTPGPWTLQRGRAIRCGDRCPLVHVAGTRDALAWHVAADALGLRWPDAGAVADAADGRADADPGLRRQLLAATGLQIG